MSAATSPTPARISPQELAQLERCNHSGRRPVVFIHGLWLLPSSWNRWAALFETEGYSCITAGWPDDPATVDEATAHPELFAGKGIAQIEAHLSALIGGLARRPILVGHSFGGLLAQWLAGKGLAEVTVAIDPAPFRGVLPLPLSALKAAWPVLGNPANLHRAVPLTFEQFRFAFANAVAEDEAQALFREFAVPASGTPLFQAATANFNPWTEAQLDHHNPARGPLLVISGEKDNTVPRAVAHAAYALQAKNPGTTEFTEIAGRGHSLTIDSGWREVAARALEFIHRVAPDARAADA